jgi:hypothetical protein
LSWEQALSLTQKDAQVLGVLLSFRLMITGLRPLDRLFYLIDSLLQTIAFTVEDSVCENQESRFILLLDPFLPAHPIFWDDALGQCLSTLFAFDIPSIPQTPRLAPPTI